MSKAEGWAFFFACLSSGRILPRRPRHIPRGPISLQWVTHLCLGYRQSWESEYSAFSFLCEEDSTAKEKLGETRQLDREATTSASSTWLSKHLDMFVPFSLHLGAQSIEQVPTDTCRAPSSLWIPLCAAPIPNSYQAFLLIHHLHFYFWNITKLPIIKTIVTKATKETSFSWQVHLCRHMLC